MATIDVIMPQMGESIAEGTLSRWLKKVGDAVKRDEPIFEISTDKVDAEIPAPNAGVLAEILVQEGQTVAVQTVVARIETEAGAGAAHRRAARRPRRRRRRRRRRRQPPAAAAKPASAPPGAHSPRRPARSRRVRRPSRAARRRRQRRRDARRSGCAGSPRRWFARWPRSTTSI